MVALVERMLELNKKKHPGAVAAASRRRSAPGGGTSPLQLDREIASTDREIDELVYELYGITDEERKIIEGCV